MNFKSLLAVALLSTACIPTTKDDTGSTSTEPATEAAAEPTSEPSSPAEPAADSTDCTGMGGEECFQCFATENPAGAQAYQDAVIGNCYCANDCAEACTDFCADDTLATPPTAECETCVGTVGNDQSSACIQGFSAECQANADCLDFAMNVQECPM